MVAEAVVLSALGMLPMILTVGTMIALYYGSSELTPSERRVAVLSYFRSPIFLALGTGTLVANLTDHDNSIAHSFLDGLQLVSSGNSLMILLTLGLLVQLHSIREIVGLGACVVFVNLIVVPLLTILPAHAIDLERWKIEVLALEGAMPAVTVSVVLCQEYGCDARLAAKLVMATVATSVITIPLIFLLARML